MTYKPSYDPALYQDKNSRQLVEIEEREQEAVANSEVWKIAKEINGYNDDYVRDGTTSQCYLENHGFVIVGEDSLFFHCKPPQGWTKSTQGYWTEVLNQNGNRAIQQFFKGAFYDMRAFVNLTDNPCL